MLNKIKNIYKDELVKGSIVLFVMINLFNILNYVFHFAMARMLEPADYGVLVVLTSVAYIFSVPSEAVQTIFSKYTSQFFKSAGKVKDLMYRGIGTAAKISAVCYVIFIPIAVFLSFFLSIKLMLLLLIGLMVFASFVTPVLRGVLQGEKKFIGLGTSLNVESVIKTTLAVLLVYIVHDVYGAVLAIVLSTAIGFLFTLALVRDIIRRKEKHVVIEGAYGYSWNTFVLFLLIVLMLSLDVILAKRFFSPEIAGQYAVASLLGKTLFFGANGVAKAMFPISSRKAKHERRGILKKAAVLTILICAAILVVFAIAPELIVNILFGGKYLAAGSIILYTGIAFSILTLTNLVVYHKLSHGKVTNPYYMFVFVLLEILILWLFSQTLVSFALGLCLANLMALAGSLFLKSTK
jgi:O-antigen/teichoic acid export membrane protein